MRAFLLILSIFLSLTPILTDFSYSNDGEMIYCKKFNHQKLFHPNIPPYEDIFDPTKDKPNNYYVVYLSGTQIIKVKRFMLDINTHQVKLHSSETFQYNGNQLVSGIHIYFGGENTKYITYNYYFGRKEAAIETPNQPITNLFYYRKKVKRTTKGNNPNSFISDVTYYDQFGRIVVKLFYDEYEQISAYKLRQFLPNKIVKEYYFKGIYPKKINNHLKWPQYHKWLNIYNTNGTMAFSFYNAPVRKNSTYTIYNYYSNGSLYKKEEFYLHDINRKYSNKLENRIDTLLTKGVSIRLERIPVLLEWTPFLKSKITYHSRRRILQVFGILSEMEKEYLINVELTEANTGYVYNIKRLFNYLQRLYVPDHARKSFQYFNKNGNVDKIEFYRDNHLYQIVYYDISGHVKKIDKYNRAGEKIFEEE